MKTAHCFGPLLPGTSNPKASRWATRGVEFSAKLRTSARKIEELEADIKELKAIPERIQALKSSIRQLEKDIVTADKANAAAGGWPKGKALGHPAFWLNGLGISHTLRLWFSP